MGEVNREELIRLVTEQVLAALGSGTDSPQNDGKRKILVIGKAENVPPAIARGAVLLDMEDYKQYRNILRYDAVHITHLTMTQLADGALGRTDTPETCALAHAFLENIPVTMEEAALPHRKYAAKQRTGLYHLYENYLQQLQVFGVKLLINRPLAEEKAAKPAKFHSAPSGCPVCHGVKNPEKVITEALALRFCGEGEVHLAADAIITPAARDIFAQKGVKVVKE